MKRHFVTAILTAALGLLSAWRVSGFLCEGPTMTMFRSPHATQEIGSIASGVERAAG